MPVEQATVVPPALNAWRGAARGLLSSALVVLSISCAGASPPPGRPAAPSAPAPADARSPAAASVPAPAPPAASEEDGASVARRPAPVPVGRRLAWVNPARCLPSCGHDPVGELVRVNERGQDDPRGAHRVDATALAALRALLGAARAAGHALKIASAFRGYPEQARVFASMKEEGRAARPGHSEHQLGTTIDLRLPSSAAIAWLAEHAPSHGFALSYPEGKQRLTGYRPEPWHIRYVGAEVAGELARRGWTLEELFRHRPELGESGSCDDCASPLSRAPCGRVTEQGRCRGTVLLWCYEGALAAVDCAASKQICGAPAGGGAPNCVAPDTGAAAAADEDAAAAGDSAQRTR